MKEEEDLKVMTEEDVLKGYAALSFVMEEIISVGKSAVLFVLKKDMWEDFMKFHVERTLKG